jgi:hypothetical protein
VLTLSGFVVALLLICGWLWARRAMAASLGTKNEPRPRLEEEVPADDWRGEVRGRYEDLTLKERNDRDRRIAAGVVKKWRRKGLP